MDILKVLSLGTSRTITKPGTDSTNQNVANLPSAGSRPHAQLYHDEVAATQGTKRKRTVGIKNAPADHDSNNQINDIDFFAPKFEYTDDEAKANASRKNMNKKTKANKNSSPTDPLKAPGSKLLCEDECKQVLRSHRLKITLLSSGVVAKNIKAKKNRGIAKAAAEEIKNAGKKQLFPQPLNSFTDLRSIYNVSPRLADNIDAQGYMEPTEVQMVGMPLLLNATIALRTAPENTQIGTDAINFVAVAPTGSGKTMSFLIPAINNIMKSRAAVEDRRKHQLEVIVLVPTRELAGQILNEARKLTVGTGVKVVVMRKGMRLETEDEGPRPDVRDPDGPSASSDDEDESGSENVQTSKSVTRADVLVATPMLLLNFLSSGKLKKKLPHVRMLVLDEADVLLDQLFREQTTGIWTACTNPGLCSTFWSATLGSNIETVIADQLDVHARARGVSPGPLVRLIVGLKDSAVPNITHKLAYTATEPGKLLALRQLLRPSSGVDAGRPLRPPFLVFTQTIERATALRHELRYDIPLEAGGSARIAVLHSSLPDNVRSDVMRRFRLGEIWVLITTDVLARGVDFAGVNGVVNYDVPSSAAVYVHRAGRTGRAGREGGIAVTFYTKEDIPFVKSVANVIAVSEKQAGRTGDCADVQKWLLDALPDVKKEDKKKLKSHGGSAVRRTARITSKSAWERRREKNRRDAIEGSKKRNAKSS